MTRVVPPETVAAHRVLRAVRESFTELPAGPIIVACSGGPDSLALAAATADVTSASGRLGGAVVVDHGLQDESADVAELAARQCSQLGLSPVTVVRVDITRGADGPEAAARSARYEAMESAAKELGAVAVLLGHSMDDQAESVLLGLARGSGTKSLAGMRPIRGLYVRPLLGVRRETIHQACEHWGLRPWTDPHNSDPAYTRVRVRDEVIPMLESQLGPGVVSALARTARIARADSDALDQWAAGEWAAGDWAAEERAAEEWAAGDWAAEERAAEERAAGEWAAGDWAAEERAAEERAAEERAAEERERSLAQTSYRAGGLDGGAVGSDRSAGGRGSSEGGLDRGAGDLDWGACGVVGGAGGLGTGEGGIDVSRLAKMPVAIRTRVLRSWIVRQGCPESRLTAEHVWSVARLVDQWRGQGSLAMPGGIEVWRECDTLQSARDDRLGSSRSANNSSAGKDNGWPLAEDETGGVKDETGLPVHGNGASADRADRSGSNHGESEEL